MRDVVDCRAPERELREFLRLLADQVDAYLGEPGLDVVGLLRTAIRCWPFPAQLAEFAERRQGFGNTDVGSGVTYPRDDDVEGAAHPIRAGCVRAYEGCCAPTGHEIEVPERVYLAVLADELDRAALAAEAERVRRLRAPPEETAPV